MKIHDEQAFTFMELMITVLIAGILATAAVVPLLKTIEAGKRRAARNVLQAIAAGENVYKTFNTINNHVYCTPTVDCGPNGWLDIFVDNPNNPVLIRGVSFTVTVTNGGNGFNATALRAGGGCNGDIIQLNEIGVETGATNWPMNGC